MQINKFGGNVVVPLSGIIGFGIPDDGTDLPTGPRIIVVPGDPAGLDLPTGSLALDSTTGQIYVAKTDTGVWASGSGAPPTFPDYSVNGARVYVNQDAHLVLESSIRTNSAGNFNGGGTGNKPIAGLNLASLNGIPLADLPRLLASVKLDTPDELGLSYNVFVDLEGNGDPLDVVVVDITSTLNSVVDANGKSGAAASMLDFDIGQFAYLVGDTTGNAYVSGGDSLNNAFYVVGNLPSYGGAAAWFNNPVSLDILLNGGVMPLTGEVFVGGFPNAVLVGTGALAGYISGDGGMPKGTPVTPVTLQIGGSGNNLRVVTEITALTVGSTVIIAA